MNYLELQAAHKRVSEALVAQRLRGENTRRLESLAKKLTARLNDRAMVSVPSRALMGVRGGVPRR